MVLKLVRDNPGITPVVSGMTDTLHQLVVRGEIRRNLDGSYQISERRVKTCK